MPLSVLNPHSPQSQIIASLFTDILILSVIVFLIVCGLVAWSLLRYRARAGADEPAPNFGSRPLEIAWTVIPLVMVIAIFIVSVRAMALIDAPRTPGKADIVITGHQWWWDARYPNGAIVAGEIHIPASRRLVARIDSADVIHDFWVPQLGRKMDAVPGLASYIWLEAGHPGTYQGVCSEFCGAQHAWMHFLVIAQPETDFSVWLNHQVEPARTPVTALEMEGARLYQEKKCGDCHAAPDKGPDLTHVAGREFLGGGVSRNTRPNLALWVAKPQSIKPGNRMPDQQLSSAEIEALTVYLGSLL